MTAPDAAASVRLTAEAVQSTSLTFQGVNDVHRSDRLALGVLRVGDGVTDDVLEEDLEDAAGLFVDQTGDTLDSATTCETTDCGLSDALDVVSQHLPVAFCASLSQSLASFAASRHFLFSRSTKPPSKSKREMTAHRP